MEGNATMITMRQETYLRLVMSLKDAVHQVHCYRTTVSHLKDKYDIPSKLITDCLLVGLQHHGMLKAMDEDFAALFQAAIGDEDLPLV